MVNLGRYSEFQLRRMIGQAVPLAMGVKIARFAKYLGFMVGPEASEHAWGPSEKLLKRARHVRPLGLSMIEACLAHKVFDFSVIRYALQLVAPSLGLVRDFGFALDIALSPPGTLWEQGCFPISGDSACPASTHIWVRYRVRPCIGQLSGLKCWRTLRIL